MPELKKTAGYTYLQDTKINRNDFFSKTRPIINSGEPYKKVEDKNPIILPRSWPKEGNSIWQLLQLRRSKREFSQKKVSLQNLARLLWAAQGVTAQAGSFMMRTAPSAGALNPIETYVAVENVSSVEKGIYHFNPFDFVLEEVRKGCSLVEIGRSALDQSFIGEASVVFIWTAVLRRNMSKYGHRGGRYVLMDVAHICENVLLAAESINLSACPIAAFYDDEFNELLNIDGEEETALYMAAVG